MKAPIDRFMEKVDRRGDDECWPFLSSIGKSGCGRFFYQGKCRDAHRIGYELMIGPIPDGLDLHHRCENRLCVNPAHLQPATKSYHHSELSPGHIAYINKRKTHCPYGHELSPDNCVAFALPYRKCLTCARRRSRNWYRARRGKSGG